MALINVSGLVTRYRTMGKGTPIVFLHGWGGSSESFGRLQRALSRKYKTVTLDLPGFGETDFPSKAWRVDDYKNFVLAFTKKLAIEKFYLVGHSFGGRITFALALANPEKLLGLVLIAPSGIKRKKSSEERAITFVAKIGKRLISLPLVNRIEEPVRYMFYKMIRRQDYYLAQGVMKETMQHIIDEDFTNRLTRITLPTLIIWGDKDTITPIEDAYTIKRGIKGAQLHVISGASHDLPRKNYDELAHHIKRFVR